MKNNKGITLVSLIVTIIVMVILAGIALVFSVGEGGIIERSQKAEVEQLLAKEKELVELAISDAKITTRNSVLTGDILTQALKNQDLEPDRELSEKAPFIFKIKDGTGKTYIVLENGEINAIDTDGEIDEEYLVNIAIETAKKSEGGLTGTNLTNALNKLGLEPNEEISETAPFIFKIKNGTGKEYVVMAEGTIGTIEGRTTDWKYKVLSDGTITITKCLLTDLNNIIIPKYLIDENGNKLTVSMLGNDTLYASYGSAASDNIAQFTGTLVIPNDVTVKQYAFSNCPGVEKVIIGSNVNFDSTSSGGAQQFNKNNVNLKEVKIGKGTKPIYYTFAYCPNIEKVIICDNANIGNAAFEGCYIKEIKIANNVTVKGRAFWRTQNEIKKITIGDNFISEGNWLENCVVKDIEIGKNAFFGKNALSDNTGKRITGTVTIKGKIKNLGYCALYNCTIKAPNDCLEIAEGATIGNSALTGAIKGINSIKLGKNVIMKYDGYTDCISPSENNINLILEDDGPITVDRTVIGGNTILPETIEFSGESVINAPFYWLKTDGKKLKKIVLNPGAKITSFGNKFPKNIQVTLKNISEWDSELLESNKAVIEAFGLTKYEEIDGNGVYTK